MINSLIALLAPLGTFGVQASKIPQLSPEPGVIPGYEVVPLVWEMETSPGGPTVYLNGTVEEVYSQLLEINPQYETLYGTIEQNAEKNIKARSEQQQQEQLNIESREYRDWTDCTINNWEWASMVRIEQGIRYLQGVSGRPTLGPGPARCSRVSCSYDSAIYWCNDNTHEFSLNTFRDIANGAQVIINDCTPYRGPQYPDSIFIRGQRFHGNLWNAIVRYDPC
ncbi:hypothetical protein QBC44DRAFT_248763 [Cladorrhinum sp. PSN332]|nr:hypothetical protein QBC44DRAFT_248763 [Cladorrhinum sp. PSN332]